MQSPMVALLTIVGIFLLLIIVGLKMFVMLLPLIIKYVLPVVAIYAAFRYVRNRMLTARREARNPPTLDLCPHCGSLLTKRHRCLQS